MAAIMRTEDGRRCCAPAMFIKMNIQLGNLGDIIHLSIAPAFLLVGVGTHLRVLTNRLARIIDRCRILESRMAEADAGSSEKNRIELDFLYRRMDLIHRAITLITCCALLICVVIAALFVDDAFNIGMSMTIAIFFILSMLSLIFSFICFLREIFISTKTFFVFLRCSAIKE